MKDSNLKNIEIIINDDEETKKYIKNNKENILKSAEFFLLNHIKYIIDVYNINHDCNIYININNLKKDDIIEAIKEA